MNRVTLERLEITNGSLPAATITFRKGLNVVSGVENRGKTFTFKCLDFLFGAKNAPKHNAHSKGYTTATAYFTVNGKQRGGISREFSSGDSYCLPLHEIEKEISSNDWSPLAKSSHAKSESISSYWLAAFGIEPTMLRRNASGDMSILTVRLIAHLILVDEMRIMAESSTARSTQSTAWTSEGDCFAYIIGGRKNPPRAAASVTDAPVMSAAVRQFILEELGTIEKQLEELPDIGAAQDEGDEIARRAEEFSADAAKALNDLNDAITKIGDAQRGLTESKSQTRISREIAFRLELLQQYYQTDLKRLDAVSETAFLLEQLNAVPCPTCLQPFIKIQNAAVGEESDEYLRLILRGATVEAAKIRRLERDLATTIEKARGDEQEATKNEITWGESLIELRAVAKSQQEVVEKSRLKLAETFETLGSLAERRSLRQRRLELLRQVPDDDVEHAAPSSADTKTVFDASAVKDFCDCVKHLLEQWKWKYSAFPLTVTFDEKTTDILISGEARDSFGKAVRAIISSAFVIGLMDYCDAKSLPHPGFVVLDSPLTTKKDSTTSDSEDEVSDDILTAFFTYLARNYQERQIIIIDNKEPPTYLDKEINHIRFDDTPLATRAGLFP